MLTHALTRSLIHTLTSLYPAQAPLPPPSKKNFIHENTMDTLRAVPKRPEPAILDSTHGRGGRQVLDGSGLVPKYTLRDDFGRVPEYLQRRKEVCSLYIYIYCVCVCVCLCVFVCVFVCVLCLCVCFVTFMIT